MNNIVTRKIGLFVVGDKTESDRVYKYLRDGMTSQNRAMNQYITALYFADQNEATKDDRKELNRLFGRISSSKKGSAYDTSIEFAKGLPSGSSVTKKVEADFKNAMKKGLKHGIVSLPTYKKDNPLIIHRDYVRVRFTNPHCDNGLFHEYESHEDFLKHLYSNDLDLFIKFVNGITFKLYLGKPKKSAELRSVLKNIFEDYYQIQGSTIEITNGKIILNLSVSIPQEEIELDENTVVGVDVGMACPAVCAVNKNDVYKRFIGSADDFLRVRTQIQHEYNRLQKSVAFNSSGHGRSKKTQPTERFHEYESNWVKNYNHKVSKKVVDFAIKNRAKYINLENLSGIAQDEKNRVFILRNWSYYQLQQFITYKAAKYGIIVRKVDPAYTSQRCSCCGYLEKGQRVSQAEFICKNPECKNYMKILNADYNAARNISMSTSFVDDEKKQTKRKEA